MMSLQEKETALSDDYGKDLASVQALQRRHEGFEVGTPHTHKLLPLISLEFPLSLLQRILCTVPKFCVMYNNKCTVRHSST